MGHQAKHVVCSQHRASAQPDKYQSDEILKMWLEEFFAKEKRT
jgi:hypothetical protein